LLQGHDIICLATDWAGHIDSSHHIMRRFMRSNRVLWVNSAGLRPPRLSCRDLRRAWNKVFSQHNTPHASQGPVAVYSPRVLPFFGSKAVNAFNRKMLTRDLRKRIRALRFRNIIVWACMPPASLVADRLDAEVLIYYVMDDYSLLPSVNTKAMLALERRLFEMSDVVFATAEHLRQAKSGYGKPITLLPHGVEFGHFRGPPPAPPKPLASTPKPIVGFFGLLAPWTDLEMMAAVAKANPELSFVFVGDVQTSLRGLDTLPNVHVFPKVSYQVLPSYARQFDVSVLPFVVDEMTLNVNPLKLMEYFAMGAPVVSTRLPAVEKYQPHVRIADTAEEFSDAIREALAADSEEARAGRVEIARANSWESRVELASSVIEEALRQKRG